MKILSAEFVKSSAGGDWPGGGLPEIAVVGRSNVGKSSLLNALLNRRALAKVSGTPGKTQLINFFRVETDDRAVGTFQIVDLPGYGYAKVARSTRETWAPMIDRYLRERGELKGIIFLIDSRGPQDSDVTTWDWLTQLEAPIIVVATKIDKLKRGERKAALDTIHEALNLGKDDEILPCSSETKEGIQELRGAMKSVLTAG